MIFFLEKVLDNRGVPYPNKKVQTIFKVAPSDIEYDTDESESMMVDVKKPFQAPQNPPPPVPHHKRHLNGSPDSDYVDATPTNGFKSSLPGKKFFYFFFIVGKEFR